MVRHIVSWNFANGLQEEDRVKVGKEIKNELENLVNLIEGIESIQVYLNHLATSEGDILLDSVFVNEEALNSYVVHPEHIHVGSELIRPNLINRKCIDVFI